jgi:beta-lactamase regulating signal transducer with metallopeptidase domain
VLSSIASLNMSAEALFDRAWSVAWQWMVLVVVLALPVQWLLRRHAPALRYWVWQVVLLKLLLMPFWTYAVPVAWMPQEPVRPPIVIPIPESLPAIEAPARPIATNTAIPLPDAAATDEIQSSPPAVVPLPRVVTSTWLIIGWGAIVVAQGVRLIYQRHRLSQLLALAIPADAALAATVNEAASLLGLSRPPRVLMTGENISPFVCGMFRPTLVLSEALGSSLSETQLRQVLLHELAHIRRRDLLWGWIPQAARMLWFFHPAVHWAVYRLRLERELACDQLAMTHSGRTAADYAQTLVEVVTQTSASLPLRKGGTEAARGKLATSTYDSPPVNP